MSVAALRDSIARIAPDDALPQLRRLLDAEAMAKVLARALPPGADPAVRIRYVSYDPWRSLLVRYEVTVDGEPHTAVAFADAESDLAETAAAPANAVLARKADAQSPATPSLSYDAELDVLVHWFPLDLKLPLLAEPPERLRAVVEGAGLAVAEHDEPVFVGYKPRRRAVFRLGNYFVKLYGKESLFARSVHNLRAATALPIRTARLEAVIPELRIEVQSLLAGRQPDGPEAAAPDAGALLRVLHAAGLEGLRSAPPDYWLRNAGGSARVLEAIVPNLGGRVRTLLGELELRTQDAPLVPCHVDFFFRQIVELDGEYGLVDFDRMSLAAPALDLATYAADVVRGPEDLERAASLLDVLCGAYGSRPAGIDWYLAVVLLRRARTPFGHFAPDWPTAVEGRVAAAERVLGLAGTPPW